MYIACKLCKYNYDGECDFYDMGSGNEIDMPCYRERELIKEAADNFIQALEQEINKEELPIWLGKRCEDCGNKKCKEFGKLPKGYDCALWQPESEGEEYGSN